MKNATIPLERRFPGFMTADCIRSGLTRRLQYRRVSEFGGKYEKVIVRGFADVRSWCCGVRAAARTGNSEFPEDQYRLLHRRPAHAGPPGGTQDARHHHDHQSE